MGGAPVGIKAKLEVTEAGRDRGAGGLTLAFAEG